MKPNFIKVHTVEEAKEVDMDIYRWSERMSSVLSKEKETYLFVKRQKEKD